MKSIETVYRGITFRSRLEAKWASFLDRIALQWTYEPQGYETSAGRYLPDFWLPEIYLRGEKTGLFLEIKAQWPNPIEVEKMRALAYGADKPVVAAYQSPDMQNSDSIWGESLLELTPGIFNGERFLTEDSPLAFCRCDACGCVGIGFSGPEEGPCQHGNRFVHHDADLEQARTDFPNLARWRPAA